MVLAGQGVGCTGRSDSILTISIVTWRCISRSVIAVERQEEENVKVKVKVKRLDEGLVRGKVEVCIERDRLVDTLSGLARTLAPASINRRQAGRKSF